MPMQSVWWVCVAYTCRCSFSWDDWSYQDFHEMIILFEDVGFFFLQRTYLGNISSSTLGQQALCTLCVAFFEKVGPQRVALAHHGGTCKMVGWKKKPKHHTYFVRCLISPDFHNVFTTAACLSGGRYSAAWCGLGTWGAQVLGWRWKLSVNSWIGESHFLPCTRAWELHSTMGMQTHT